MKKFILLLTFLILFSCTEKFNPKEFKGTWVHYDNDNNYYDLPAITFREDSVFLEDVYTYVIKGKYEVIRNKISYYLKNDTLNYKLEYNSKDSTIIIGKHKYVFWEGYSNEPNYKYYDLINIKKKNEISLDSLLNYDTAFHIFKNSEDSLKLRLNDKISSKLSLISRFTFRRHKPNKNTIIYLGKNIKLKDIIKCYLELSKVNIKKVFLLTGFDIKTNTYYGFLDNFEVWSSQINFFSKEKIEPIYSNELSRKKYIQEFKPNFIIINSEIDFVKIDNINFNTNYFIQINSDMSIEDYISLKEKISKIKKIKIRTEFFNL